MKPVITFLSGLILTAVCAQAAPSQTDFERDCAKLAKTKSPDAERLHALFKLDWENTMHENPEWATEVGYAGQNDRWSDVSLETIERHKRELQAPLAVIKSIKRDKLSAADQLNFDLFKRNLDEAIEGTRFKGELMSVNQMGGVQQDIARVLEFAPHTTLKDYRDIVKRLQTADAVIDGNIPLLRKGLEAGLTPPKITLRDVPQQVKNQMVAELDKSPMLLAFREFPESIPAAEQEKLRAEAVAAVKQKIIPAYGRLHDFLVNEYIPKCRESVGLNALPDGKDWYAFNSRVTTTTTMTPEQIHALGLSEVKRIRAEMDKVIAETGFKGSFAEFQNFLRTDPQFHYTNADDLLRGYRDICKRVDPELAHLFGKLPRLTYGVIPVPSYAEKSQTTAYYQPGAPEIGRPGYFYANTYAVETRLKWEMEALTLHESVPGHHLQIALAKELENVPEFRKNRDYTAFVEGWGLYSESLGYELGMYKDPYQKFGQLVYEMWRAIRLVVDTGMHTGQMTRQEAIDFFLANTTKSEHDVTVEVDRYIVWPGQALAYKIGQLKLRELRNYATKELGDKFDVRQFHDQVLGQGALPLDVLEKRIKAWVAEKKAGK
ncbi:MAG: DUF885 domain-containing protein [Verrucomicrobia bacterium]|nr:MAG: DUF885 domain-containing protein [Verrucomicrobiota bacterium]